MDISRFSGLSERAPSRDDVLAALGLEARRSAGAVVARDVGLVAMGLVAGAGLALLFAPRSGRALRQDLSARARDLREAGDGSSQRSGVHASSAG